ncbi:MAG: hypothetical protein PHS02_04025 [Candidatus ainarchaeum sp.]|nr:hypothetical protein [Candidatus ainarchaeum sp.]
MKGQVSTELLVVIGFVVLLFIPLIMVVYYKTNELNRDIGGMQSRLLTSKLAFIANSLGYLGSGNSLKSEFSLPEGVRTLEFNTLGNGGEVRITLADGSQISQVTSLPFDSPGEYAGGGSYKLEFLSKGGKIYVTKSA